MKVGDIVFAEHHDGGFWVGLIVEIWGGEDEWAEYMVLWNDGDKTMEDMDTLLSPGQKEDLEEMNGGG